MERIKEPATLPPPPVKVTYSDPYNVRSLLLQAAKGAPSPVPTAHRWYALNVRAHALRTPPSFDTLLAPTVLYDRIRPHAYQLRVVGQVLRDKAPAAVLADEVGLGKTIEAGLIYKELALRGMVRSALILTPKALLSQWQTEMLEHFDEDFVLTDEKRFESFAAQERIICSLPQFVRSFEKIASRNWDMVIVDEAHLLANPTSKRRRSVALLRARWRLLLTATPISNKLIDLYSLIDLVRPGMLGTQKEFENEYVADPGTARMLKPHKAEQLRSAVRQVICRTRRSETDIVFSGRSVHTRSIAATPTEDALINDITEYLRQLYRRLPPPVWRAGEIKKPTHPLSHGGKDASAAGIRLNRGAVIREIVALQQSLCSSPHATLQSLKNRAKRHPDEQAILLALADRCERVESAKERLLLEVLDEVGPEPALIFTLRLETAAHLRAVISTRRRSAECYIGSLSRDEREAIVEKFTTGAIDTLIATDAGAEGLNLQQRCHVVFNYDLHWNPMRIEQRIGRIHRLGQQQDVAVYNFALRDTIDDYVLRLLYQKINLFTMTIGALETVLSEVQEGELDIEERILDALLHSDTPGQVAEEIGTLGEALGDGLQRQRYAETLTAGVLG
ncbi:MAG: DEAD/DEAH box helicase [Ktedonobacterales bacterium]